MLGTISVCCECCVLSGRGLCDALITRPEETTDYRQWCVVVCDLETSRMRRPWPALGRSATGIYIYIYIEREREREWVSEYSRLCRRHAIPYQYPQFQLAGEQSTILTVTEPQPYWATSAGRTTMHEQSPRRTSTCRAVCFSSVHSTYSSREYT